MGRYFLILGAIFLLCGCSKRGEAPAERRIASLSAAAAVILNKLGTPPAAVDQYSAVVAAPSTPVIGKGTALSVEKLLELRINTLIVWSYQKNALEYLKRYGIELIEVTPCRISDFPELIRKLGEVTGKREKAAEIIAGYQKIFDRTASFSGKKKSVYFELYTRNRGAGDESFIGDLIRAAGGESILKKSSLTGTEYIVKKNPEVIFFVENFSTRDEIMKRSGFAAVEAVKRNAVFPVPRELLIEGAFLCEAVEYLRKRMY